MRIEFLKEWMKYRIGDVTEDVASGVADVLFMRRIARPALAVTLVPAEIPAEIPAGEPEVDKPAQRVRRRA